MEQCRINRPNTWQLRPAVRHRSNKPLPTGSRPHIASIPDPAAFRSGRDLSAWIGLVPKQHSTGGKERLGSISKAGNRYLRQLLVIGALSVIRRAKQLGYTRHPWLVRLLERRSTKIAAVALANKIARIAWAMMARNESYQPSRLSPVS